MGRKDRRQQTRQALNHSSRKPVKADHRVLIALGTLAVVFVLVTFFARNSGAF